MKKNEMSEQWDPQIDNLGIIVAHHHYGTPVSGKFHVTPPPPYDEARDRWTLQPRVSANTIVRLKKSEITLHPRRGFWVRLFGQKA